ncbi:type VI secretion system tube protein Hcp [Vibrio parahaemolyticus]|uniref:Type VI secretion system tube protein Hcp n=1 Tax=Vibrio parahaemolyticus TaxID=670 RepID=A0A9Q3UGV2_VIBPH|nr:type VI secretion system tube protein TssD [Vibrio parahaemolyticus]MCC3807677.1 type VI secretion system tube protein Hcp [Vibrio parahaemolyticus]
MATIAYLKIDTTRNACLTQGCNTEASMGQSYQEGHEDEITVLSYSHMVAHEGQAMHVPLKIVKRMDKSSPLLSQACTEATELECTLKFYRLNASSGQECFYEIELKGAVIKSVTPYMAHTIDFNEREMEETITIAYRDIQWRHVGLNTTGYSTWLSSFKNAVDTLS